MDDIRILIVSFWDNGIALGLLFDNFGILLESFRIVLGSLRDHFGIVSGLLLNSFVIDLG